MENSKIRIAETIYGTKEVCVCPKCGWLIEIQPEQTGEVICRNCGKIFEIMRTN